MTRSGKAGLKNGDAGAMKILSSKRWALDRIKEYPHNPRTHPPAQVALLAQLMTRYGPDQDIVVDEHGVILKGHGRKLAAREAGFKDYPVTQRLGLSEDDKRAMRIADNQVALLSGWDNELVRFELEALKRADYPVALLGFGDAQLVQFTTVPGPPAGGFQAFGENIPTQFCCPSCKYAWSGDPEAGKVKDGKPGAGNAEAAKAAKKKK